MNKKKKITEISDEEIIKGLASDYISIDDFYLLETSDGSYTLGAKLVNGEEFTFFWEDDLFYQAALEFMKKRGTRIVTWDEYIEDLRASQEDKKKP